MLAAKDAAVDSVERRVKPGRLTIARSSGACRTATLGGHVERCDDCGLVRVAWGDVR
ncbi:hypothetical protein H8A97_41510 [Bradyrhizobium sp. Arg62]|uniref:hypothetical protein n=1 Tax=Bradyrhizobium TaxID=374 RepID=UPI001E495585|nr:MULTISPECIES: hypothetical protein [Bradyrhizobium]MCC8942512.1 hypothetical protein [Bradyrhizobium ivorense]MCC8951354.1 hypothetical protein [Bradyrhizobium brasilense]